MDILVTGGAGFIGSNFLRRMVPRRPDHRFTSVDHLGYAGNLVNLAPLRDAENHRFERLDLTDAPAIAALIERLRPERVVHFAADSHVDRSIDSPAPFVENNVLSTLHLLEAFRRLPGLGTRHFHHVGTDEVYGAAAPGARFHEASPYDPSSPYAASKAAADHLVRAWGRTYGLPFTISAGCNTYGPRQYPEKLVPLMILAAAERRPLPVYGDGSQVRDWLHVDDHCDAVWAILERGHRGETYNVAGDSKRTNLELVHRICDLVAESQGASADELRALVRFVADRPGHDRRYALDGSKLARDCNFRPAVDLDAGLRDTVTFYLSETGWVAGARSGDYRAWIDTHYGEGGA